MSDIAQPKTMASKLTGWIKPKEPSAPADIASATLRSDQFRLQREWDWTRLEEILKKMEKGQVKSLPDEELLALPALYRTAASSLSVARETSLDAATLAYLEQLVQRAWFQVYGPRHGFFSWFRSFLFGGWSSAVRAIWLDICIGLFFAVAGTIVGWLLCAQDQEWYYRLVPTGLADTRVPTASSEQLLETVAVQEGADGLSVFAASLFSHNSTVAILAFALGFAFGIPSLFLLISNFAMLGGFLWLFSSKGLTLEIVAWLSVHGTTELFAILLAAAAGMHIGRSMTFPGNKSVLEAMSAAGRRSAMVMAGVVIMLLVAGLLEAFPRQLVAGEENRLLIGVTFLLGWIVYFFLYRPKSFGDGE